MSHRRPFCPRSSASTLVELLVVLGIIALLLPVLTGARRAATLAACASNLHQVSLALQMYASDSSGAYPPDKAWDRPSP